MSSQVDQDFERAILFLRDAYVKKAEDQVKTVQALTEELSQKEDRIQSLMKTNFRLESTISGKEKEIDDLHKTVKILTKFKENVVGGLTEEDLSSIKMVNKDVSQAKAPEKSYLFATSPTANRLLSSSRNTSSSYSHVDMSDNLYGSSHQSSFKQTNSTLAANQSGSGFLSARTTPKLAAVPNAVDGRSFFKKARSILPYDKFTALLWNVKSYNNRENSREQTLDSVEQVLLPSNKELWFEFKTLLN